jgi:uncharacterized protein (TIGR04255 family)
MRLPSKITPDSIEEAVTEVRFESSLPSGAIFGVIYKEFGKSYPAVEQLPILQLPDFVREKDPNLIFQAHYRLKKENYVLQVGPKVLALGVAKPYSGWPTYRDELIDVFNRVKRLEFIDKVTRFGHRYIDFFQFNIFDKIDLAITMNGESAVTDQSFFRTVIRRGIFRCNIQIGNDAVIEKEGVRRAGSIFDIDTAIEDDLETILLEPTEVLEAAHLTQKQIFFRLLKPEFIESLNPEYEEESAK